MIVVFEKEQSIFYAETIRVYFIAKHVVKVYRKTQVAMEKYFSKIVNEFVPLSGQSETIENAF